MKEDKQGKHAKKPKGKTKKNKKVFNTVPAWTYGAVLSVDPSVNPVGPIIYRPIANGNVYSITIYKPLGSGSYLAHASIVAEVPPAALNVTTLNISTVTVSTNGAGGFASLPAAAMPFAALITAPTGAAPVYHRIADVVATAANNSSVNATQVQPLFNPVNAEFLGNYIAITAVVGGQAVLVYVQLQIN